MKCMMRCRQHTIALACLCALFLLGGCGVYSKVAAVNPEQQEWEGPLLDQADMEHVQIIVKPRETTIVLKLDDDNADLSLLLGYASYGENQHTITVNDAGGYVLVIQKQEEL